MKATYRIVVKSLWRERWREFIAQNFNLVKRVTAHVLCLPGPEALEIKQVYDKLGIPRGNIVCIEGNRKAYNELKRRHLGVDLRHQTLDEFLDSPCRVAFDIVSLDLCGQLGTYEPAIHRLRKRGFIDDEAIVASNFCGAREARASQGYYHCAEFERLNANRLLSARSGKRPYDASQITVAHSDGEWLWELPLGEVRSGAMHRTIRSTLTECSLGTAELLYRERNRNGSLTRRAQRMVNSELRRLQRTPLPAEHRKLVEYAEKMAYALKRREGAPGVILHGFVSEARNRVRTRVKRALGKDKDYDHYEDRDIDALVAGLASCLDILLSRPALIRATQSFKYVSDRGTPMYADFFRIQRISECDFLGATFSPAAKTLGEFLKPLQTLTGHQVMELLEGIRGRLTRGLVDEMTSEPAVPERIDLGRESTMRQRRLRHHPARDDRAARARCVTLLAYAPQLTNEDLERVLGVGRQRIAGWKAHLTMGTYSPESRALLYALLDQACSSGHFARALDLSSRLIKREPQSVRSLRNHALILWHLGRSRQGLDFIAQAAVLAPGDATVPVIRAKLLDSLEQGSAAVAAYKEGLTRDPSAVSVRVELGRLLTRLGRWPEAQHCFQQTLELDPKCIDAECGLANAISLQGSPEAARRRLNVALRRTSGNAQILLCRSGVLMALGDHEAAIHDLRQAFTACPDDALIPLKWAVCLANLGRPRRAKAILLKAVELDPTHAVSLHALGLIYLQLRDYPAAIEVFGQALKRHPSNLHIRICRVYALVDAGLTREALTELNRLLDATPHSRELRLERAHLLLDLERFVDAEAELRHLLRDQPEHPQALLGLAFALVRREAPEALDVAERALAVDPDNPAALVYRGHAWMDRDEWESALKDFDRVLALAPRSTSATTGRAIALSGLGRHSEGLRCLNRVLRNDPNNTEALHAKAGVLASLGRTAECTKAFSGFLRCRMRRVSLAGLS
ncbi:MAG TPA: tetratricopeptide repeat protein [Steroidobacteraceae bacterium]|jgi:tetratricopeptide (TPR) repeat protein